MIYVPFFCTGVIDEVILEGQVLRRTYSPLPPKPDDPCIISGLPEYKVDIQEHIDMEKSRFCNLRLAGPVQEAHFHTFPPGSVIVFK